MADGVIYNNPFYNCNFKVSIGAKEYAFSEVSGLTVTVDPVEYRVGNDKAMFSHKFPGMTKFGNVTFKWGMAATADDYGELLEWYKNYACLANTGFGGSVSDSQRKTIGITMIDNRADDGVTTVPSWKLKGCFPVSLNVPDLNAASASLAIQSLEVTVDSFEFVSILGTANSAGILGSVDTDVPGA